MEAQPWLRLGHCWLFPSSLQIALKRVWYCVCEQPHQSSIIPHRFLEGRVSATHPGYSWSEGTFPYQQRSPLEPHLVGELWLHPHECEAVQVGQSDPHWNHGPSARSHITISHHLTPKQLPRGNNSPSPRPLAVFKHMTWRWKGCVLFQSTPASILGGMCL